MAPVLRATVAGGFALKETLQFLHDRGISAAELAAALDRKLTEVEQWMRGDLSTEAADIIEVGISLFVNRLAAVRARNDERTERVAAQR